MKYNLFLYLVVGGMLASSTNTYSQEQKRSDLSIIKGGKIWTSLWQQRAAEYKALCFQAYNIATLRLNMALATHKGKPLAIVTDIDETILDNSPNSVSQSLNNKDYELKAWKEWTAKGSADTIPGAVAFFQYAANKGVKVFYISNRDEDEKQGTLMNLKRYGFPYADQEHLLLRQDKSGKESRRSWVAKDYEISLLIGDNLSDFAEIFDKRSVEDRASETSNNAKIFGNKFIILPNANYGDWEGALFKYNYGIDEAKKKDIIIDALRKE